MSKKKDKDIVVDVETAEEKLGPELIGEIADKEWKTAPLPTEEDLAKEKHKSPKARSNPKSRANLLQYRKDKPTKAKKEVVKALKFPKKRADVNPFDFIKLPENYPQEQIASFLPDRRVMKDVEEEKTFYTVLNSFLSDFDLDELSSSDIEDVVSLAVNRVLEYRLLAITASDPNLLMDAAATIEKFRKHSEKVKGNLAARRSDRIDPKNKQNFSIVDLVYAHDAQQKSEFEDRLQSLAEEKKEFERLKSKK